MKDIKKIKSTWSKKVLFLWNRGGDSLGLRIYSANKEKSESILIEKSKLIKILSKFK